MSERMTSVEIEDVLSSIRRLVTQDLRPKPPVVEDKLLLTPALRVVPDVDAAETEAPFVEAEDVTPVFVHRAAPHDLAGAVTSIGAEVSGEGYEPETGEYGPADAMAVPDWPDQSWVAPDIISDVDDAEVVALTDHAPGWAQTDDREEPGQVDVAEAAFVDVDDDPTVYDPMGDGPEAEALAALQAEDTASLDTGLTELDEDMLRDIVRDIIREELHGSLGERITRNVRKLVRAEINRAMVARDLE